MATTKIEDKQFILGKFWDPEETISSLKELFKEGVPIYDVFSPFPLHEIEPYLGIKRTRLTVAAFIYGALGLASAIALQAGLYGLDWPMNIGGKPSLAFPSFVPISFEMTVLFAAHGMVITFMIVSRFWPGKKVKLADLRQTDDVFVVALDKEKVQDEARVREILASHGAFEVIEKGISE